MPSASSVSESAARHPSKPSQTLAAQRIPRLIIAALGLLLCLWGVWTAGRAGLSRVLSQYAVLTTAANSPLLAPADEAVALTPKDPDAHFGRAAVLWGLGSTTEAIEEYELAAALRPRDYYLWMVLGNSRDLIDDEKGALAALNEAVRTAPFYAQPRWQFGNVLFRAGQLDRAFEELRRAALSDQKFLPNMIDLAWGISNNDAAATEQLVRPENKQWRMALSHFFARKGQTNAALNLYRAAGNIAEEERRTLVGELLAVKGYPEAYAVWAAGATNGGEKASVEGAVRISNGSFESPLSFDEAGFGWQFTRDPNTLQVSLDTSEPRTGAHSLRLDWKGNAPSAPTVSQLILVEPNARYRLSFAARTQEIVSGALPLLVLMDKSSADNRVLAQSKALPKGTSGWQDYSVEFATGENTRAVLVGLQREACGPEPCPIFGRLWLDNFSIQKL